MTTSSVKRNLFRPYTQTEEDARLKNHALGAVQDGVAIADASLPDAPLIYVNAAFERLTGYSASEAQGRPHSFLQGSASDPVAREKLRVAIQEQHECCVELLHYRKDGKTFLSRIALTPLRDAQNKVTHFIAIQSDITEQKRVEEALSTTAAALQATFVDIQKATEATRAAQRAVLPEAKGEFHGVRFAASVLRCPELAGDLLSYFPLDAQSVGFYIADVRAQGIPAALDSLILSHFLFAPAARSVLYRPSRELPGEYEIREPVEVVEKLRANSITDQEVAPVAIFYGVFDVAKGELRYASLGQIGIVVLPARSDPVLLGPAKFPASLYPEAFCEQKMAKMGVGDRLYLCTDGITDALDGLDERFGMEGFVKAIDQSSRYSLDESAIFVKNAVRDWYAGKNPDDDASLLAVEITG